MPFKDPERYREYKREYYQRRKKHFRKVAKEYYQKHREAILIKRKEAYHTEEDLCGSCRFISDCDLRELCPTDKTIKCVEYMLRVHRTRVRKEKETEGVTE